MSRLTRFSLATSFMMLFSMPAHAFFEQMVDGMTRVTSKLIDSSEKVAIHGMNTTSTTILLLSNDIGKMADRIDAMADKIGQMADRIVYTERMMSDFAHKLVDTGADLARVEPMPRATRVAGSCSLSDAAQAIREC